MKFNVTLRESREEKCKIPYNYLERNDLLALLEFNCIMDININDKLFFSEGICPLEFRFQFVAWLNEIHNKRLINFSYTTEDDAVNPVLEFKMVKDRWKIVSVFQNYNCNSEFCTEDLIDFSNQFGEELNKFIVY